MLGGLDPVLHLLGRILFALVFILSGLNHLTQQEAMTGYARAKGLPAPGAATVVSGVVIIVAGLMIVLGLYPVVAAFLLFFFLLGTAFLMHAFWKETDPQAKQSEMAHFLKDLALAGAALLIAYMAADPWPLSL